MIIDAENVSNECFVNVFHRLDKKTLVNCMLACRRFERIISSDSFWIEQSRIRGTPDVFPSLAWRRAANQKKFEGNEDGKIDVSGFKFNLKRMVTSGRGYSPIVPRLESHFEEAGYTIDEYLLTDEVSINGRGYGICMEINGGVGCQPHPDVSKCFAFSYARGAITLFIDLVKSGIDPWVLDYVRPKIRISQKVNHRFDCSAKHFFAAQLDRNAPLIENEMEMVHAYGILDSQRFKSFNKRWEQWTENEWEDWMIEFDDYPSGMRHLTVFNEGVDGKCWAGFYGPKIANIRIQVVMPEIPKVQPLSVEYGRRRVDELPAEGGGPVRVAHRRHIRGVPPVVPLRRSERIKAKKSSS